MLQKFSGNIMSMILCFGMFVPCFSQQKEIATKSISEIGLAWAGNSVNTVVFRRNSVVSFKNKQYVAYYDANGNVILAKRKLGTQNWEIKKTPYKGNFKDAHNSISIMIDGDGFLHVAWDHHASKLRYVKSISPESLELTEEFSMVGKNETKVTYPEFYKLKNGDLLFLYRDGSSGKGNLILNKYATKIKQWERIQDNLIDGQGLRNAYWQACIDDKGIFHLSWVWRESSDVASNHDMCYAKSLDGGKTWLSSENVIYPLPLNINVAPIIQIPQKSELINSTSITIDKKGHPYIATYWRSQNSDIPQYQLIYFDGLLWKTQQISDRKTPFSLSGVGTKKIPISRPQLVVNKRKLMMIFRDEERGNRVSVAINQNLEKANWEIKDLTTEDYGQWEPSYDTELWRAKKKLHIFLQKSEQGDGEKSVNIKPQPVKILAVN